MTTGESVQQIGQYRIEGQIGEGGMGAVYVGHHVHLGMKAAIKTILRRNLTSDDAVVRLLDEGRALAKLQHPNIVRVLDFFESGGNYYLVMEYIEGQSLRDRLEQAPIDLGEALRISRAVGTGLVAAHSQNILHRDIKPSNVLIGATDEVKLTDFGLAKFVGAASKTKAGFVVGTPRYMAPETVRGDDADERSDQYAFGTLLYRLVTGEEPFTGQNALEIMQAQVSKLPRPPRELNPHIPLPLQDLILKSLEKDPALRFPSMARMMVDLNHLAKGVITASFDAAPASARSNAESPTVAIARDLEKALEDTVPPGAVQVTLGRDNILRDTTPEPDVETINPAREVKTPSSGQNRRPPVARPASGGGSAPSLQVYRPPAAAPPPIAPAGRGVWIWGAAGAGLVIVGLVAAVLKGREAPRSTAAPTGAAAPASAPGAPAPVAGVLTRFSLVGAPLSLYVDPVPPPSMIPASWSASDVMVYGALREQSVSELRDQLTPSVARRHLFEAILAMRGGSAEECVEPARLAVAEEPGPASAYVEASCRLARRDFAGAAALKAFPADSFNAGVLTLITGPDDAAIRQAELFARSDRDPAALYLAGRFYLLALPARARKPLGEAMRYGRNTREKTEIEQYLNRAPA